MKYLIQVESIQQFEELVSQHKTVGLYFANSTWQVCNDVLPKVLAVTDQYQLPVLKIETKKHKTLSGQYLVFTVPTIILLHEGEEILRESRFIDFAQLDRILSFLD